MTYAYATFAYGVEPQQPTDDQQARIDQLTAATGSDTRLIFVQHFDHAGGGFHEVEFYALDGLDRAVGYFPKPLRQHEPDEHSDELSYTVRLLGASRTAIHQFRTNPLMSTVHARLLPLLTKGLATTDAAALQSLIVDELKTEEASWQALAATVGDIFYMNIATVLDATKKQAETKGLRPAPTEAVLDAR